MSEPSPLKGRHRWLTNMSTVAVGLGIGLASAYAAVVLDFPPGTRLAFGVILVVVSIIANTLGDGYEQRRLLTLRKLGDGHLPATPEHLVLAAREAMAQPDLSFWLSFIFLSLGALVTSVAWAAVTDVPALVAARVGLIGLVLSPLTATLALLVSIPRARIVLRELVKAGLPVTELYAGVPVGFVLRRRLMIFSVVAVLSPTALLIDLGLWRLRALLDGLVAAPDAAAMQAVSAAQQGQGLMPIVGLVVLMIVVVSLSAWLSGSILGDPLKELAAETERLARGEHGEPRFIPGEHETFAAAGAIASMESELMALLGRLGHAARGLTGATSSLSEGQLPADARRVDQRQSLDATSATTFELARSARDIAVNAHRVSELARQTRAAARAGRDSADGFLAAMGQVREGNQAIADSVVRLNKRVQQVGRIIEFINGIADKSDLLALNAELEGNKAGEVGRGFSLVAAEMRRLAESVMQSTREIGRLIEEIRDATNAAVMATEAGVKATDAGAALAQKVGLGLSSIVEFANQSSDAMQSISLATAQQQQGTDQLVGAMADILRSTEATAAASQDMVAAHDQLLSLGRDLEQTVERYQVTR